jgi:hypothetical protein
MTDTLEGLTPTQRRYRVLVLTDLLERGLPLDRGGKLGVDLPPDLVGPPSKPPTLRGVNDLGVAYYRQPPRKRQKRRHHPVE